MAQGVSDAIELVKETPPYAVVLDLFGGSEDAWQQLKPSVNGSQLIVAGKFTPDSVAKRLQPDAYVANGNVRGVINALLALNHKHSP